MSWAVLRAHRTPVRTLGFAPDGLQLLSGDEEGYVVLWSLESRRPLVIWQAHTNALLTTEFWPAARSEDKEGGSSLLVTHARDNKLRIWRHPWSSGTSETVFNTAPLPTGTLDANVPLAEAYTKPWLVYTQDVNALNFCSIALASETRDHRVFAAPATIASERIDVYSLDESFGVSRPFKALNASDGVPLDTQLFNESNRGLGAVMAMCLTQDLLVAGYESGHLAAFDLSDGNIRFVVQPHSSPILSLAQEGPYVFVSAADRKLSVVDLRDGSINTAAELTHKGVATVDTLTINESLLAITAGWDGKVRLFSGPNATDLDEVHSFHGGRQAGITAARIMSVTSSQTRRLRPLPSAWIAVAGKDSRVGLYPYTGPTRVENHSKNDTENDHQNIIGS